jgi:NDP-sugar pyrophosphorylase family protein
MMMPNKGVGLLVLAGGKATRLQSVLYGRPKALIQFSPWRPVVLDMVSRASAEGMEVCIATDAYSFGEIESFLHEHGQVSQISVDAGRGTGSAIQNAIEHMESSVVIVCNADTVIPVDILAVGRDAPPLRSPVRQILTPYSTQNSGLIGVSENRGTGYVVHWGETTGDFPAASVQRASSSGAYIIRRKPWLYNIDPGADSLEQGIMPTLVSEAAVEAYIAKTLLPTYDFGVPRRIYALQHNKPLRDRLFRASGAKELFDTASYLPGVQIV